MEKVERLIIEQNSSHNDAPTSGKERGAHEEALAFVEAHRDFFEHYARGKVTFEPAPEGMDTFAFDLNTNTIYVNSRFYKELGFSDVKTAFATLHEAEHFMEKKQMLTEEGGAKTFSNYLKRISESEAYGLMDNCIADIRENGAVVAKTNSDFRTIEEGLYREELFKETDFTRGPRHVQFCQALLREGRIPDEVCTLAPAVRVKLDALRDMKDQDGQRLLDIFTNPNVPMSYRLKFQNHYVWPIVKALLDEDMKESKEQGSPEGDGGKASDGKDGEGKGDKKGEGKEKEGEGQEDTTGEAKSQKGKPSPSKGKPNQPNPNDIFRDAYEAAKKQVVNAVPVGALAKAFEDWKKEHAKNPLDEADNAYAEAIGVKKEDLRTYRNIVARLEKMNNSQTGENVVEELHALFSRIISSRQKPQSAPRYPTEEGEDLVDPAELVAQVKAGNLEPKVWETTETRERKGAKFGEVEVTAVGDRSGSMEGEKLRAQQEAFVLMMEALKKFADECDEERVNMDKPLEVRSEIYTFQGTHDDGIPQKRMSKELGEKERIDVAMLLGSAPGDRTPDYISLEAIAKLLDDETLAKIVEGELKKIVIVFTDGESDDPARVEQACKEMRQKGVVVVGVGITADGESVLTTYAPNARVAKKTEELTEVLADLLREHLLGI